MKPAPGRIWRTADPRPNEHKRSLRSGFWYDDCFIVLLTKDWHWPNTLPTEASGLNMLMLPDREETWVHRLFERAIGGFYDVVLRPQGWHVKCGGTLDWQISHKTVGIDRILPSMRTDVVLDYPLSGRRIVIDTQFNSIVTSGWYERNFTQRLPCTRILRLPAITGG